MNDLFGNAVSTASQTALGHFDRATDAHLHAWPGVGPAIEMALAEAPDFALPHALQAMTLHGRGLSTQARAAVAQARACASKALPREKSFVDLIATVIEGSTRDALAQVIDHMRLYPRDVLAASTAMGAYGLFAFSGQADHDARRLAFTESLATHFDHDFPWLLAYRGWARIELGAVDEGLAMAREALALRPQNAHNAHIVLHGLFEQQKPEACLTFVDEWLPGYADDALMWGHIQWHAALAEIEVERVDAAVARLMGPIAAYLPRGAPFMGLADIASLLWRLGLQGRRGLPWALAQAHAAKHFPKGANVFGELHLAMLAAARADRPALDSAKSRLQAMGDAGHAGAATAMQWARSLVALLDGEHETAQAQLDACNASAVSIGGSHAQRQVIALTRQALRLPDVDDACPAATPT